MIRARALLSWTTMSLAIAVGAVTGCGGRSESSELAEEDDAEREGSTNASTSPGSVRIVVNPADGVSYCETLEDCELSPQPSVLDARGVGFNNRSYPYCALSCDGCQRLACIDGIAPAPCVEVGVDTGQFDFSWNGSNFTPGTCEQQQCSSLEYAPEGEYTFRYCAARGALVLGGEAVHVCEHETDPAGERIIDCVTTSFVLDGTDGAQVPIELTLGGL